MLKGKLLKATAYFFLVAITIVSLETIGYFALYIKSNSFDFLSNKNYFYIRAMLLGANDPDLFPRYLSLPYLGYIPYPGYKRHNVIQHNEDGYRGTKVPLIKKSKFRVLCLGGSTTYGFGVESPQNTYPAKLEILLNQFIQKNKPVLNNITGAEVINAGIDAGVSSEELQQYLFKYRYYQPDAVIVHSGINDALVWCSTADSFQLDYTHYRRLNFHLEPLPKPARVLIKSYLLSFFVIQLFYSDFSVFEDGFIQQTNHTYCRWSKVNIDSVSFNREYSSNPFFKNTQTLFREIVSDSAALFVLPNILNRENQMVKNNLRYQMFSNENIRISHFLCEQNAGIPIAYNYDSTNNPTFWIDDCHLKEKGEARKAQIVAPYLERFIQSRYAVH